MRGFPRGGIGRTIVEISWGGFVEDKDVELVRRTSAFCWLTQLAEAVGNSYFLLGEGLLALNPPAVF